MTRHWTINGRFLSQPLTGVQRYAYEVVRELDRLVATRTPLAQGLEIEIVAPPDAVDSMALSAIGSRVVGRAGGHLWEQTVLPSALRGGLISLCNTGPLSVRKQIVCIHDANTRNYPESYSRAFRSLYRMLMPAIGSAARQVATVSHFSAGELARFGIAKPRKIFVATNGHEHAARWEPRHSAATRSAAGPRTIVLIGSNAPHKNTGLVVGMADRLAAAGLKVAVVGMSDQKVFKATRPLPQADNVAWLGRLSDDELAALLGELLCLAFPSYVEGFGLPPLEAMTRGCPVVASDRACMPEICGEGALYADPDDPEAWIGHFVGLAETPSLRAELAERGLARSQLFSWRATAERYLKAMAEADGLAEAAPPLAIAAE